jgi:hypothetical protein
MHRLVYTPFMDAIKRITGSHYRIAEVPRLGGFAAEAIQAGATGSLIARCFLHSGDVGFHKIIEQFFNLYLGRFFLTDQVSQFLIVIHADLSADVYINDVPCELRIRAKRSIKAFEAVGNKDLADIEELRFVNVELAGDDRVVYCFKRGWRFGLYFDLAPIPKHTLDVEQLYKDLGRYFRRLSFYDEYATLEDSELFGRLFADGWFPFMEIIGGEFDTLADAYRQADKAPGLYSDFLTTFNEDRILKISERWWSIRNFADKRSTLQAGLDAYLTGTPGGYINSIKTLWPAPQKLIKML